MDYAGEDVEEAHGQANERNRLKYEPVIYV
jgi:hypothetical protein